MDRYCMNENSQTNDDHEVHILNGTCDHLPNPENRKQLGEHSSCHGAVRKALQYDSKADGCFYCCNACHTS
jgi:hypothetical protein